MKISAFQDHPLEVKPKKTKVEEKQKSDDFEEIKKFDDPSDSDPSPHDSSLMSNLWNGSVTLLQKGTSSLSTMIQNSHLQDYLPQKHENAKPEVKDLHVSKLLKVQSVLQKALLGHSQLDEDG